MKKVLAVLMTVLLTIGLCACGGGAEPKTYSVSYNVNNGNNEDMPDYQFLSADVKFMLGYDSRLYVDIALELDGEGNYNLTSDCYVIEGGKKAEVGDDTGIGMTWITTATGTYTENEDGTITISAAKTATHEMKTDTYSSQMKDAIGMNVNGSTEDGKWTSEEEAAILAFVPETIFTVDEEGKIVSYAKVNPDEGGDNADTENEAAENEATENVGEGNEAATGNEVHEALSDDQGTKMKFFDNGTYEFIFESYSISDIGSYSYDAATNTVTLTDANGKETVSTVDGDNIKFHYEYSQSNQLTGDYTIAIADLAKLAQ